MTEHLTRQVHRKDATPRLLADPSSPSTRLGIAVLENSVAPPCKERNGGATSVSAYPTTHATVLPLFSPAAEQPTKRYRTIVADPPWAAVLRPPIRFDGRESETNSYGTMTNHEIEMLPLPLWAGKDAHLYLWALNSNLVAAHRIAEAWGFTVKTVITWVKGRFEAGRLIQHIGLGNYYRNSTEHVLFGVRGSQSTLNSDMPTAFIAERHAHSEKPAAFYDMVQRMSPGPYLDVFARKQRFGWDTWGDEAFDFRTHGIWHNEETE